MFYFTDSGIQKEKGKFKKYKNGYCTFILESGQEIDFEEVHKRVLKKYDLTSGNLINKNFKITYSEVIDDFSNDDFIVYRVEDLEQI